MKRINRKQILTGMLFFFCFLFLLSTPVFATGNKIMDSNLFTGTVKLIEDLTAAIRNVAGGLAVLVIIFIKVKEYFIKNEAEEKETNFRTKTVIKGLLIIFTISTILNLILSYFTDRRVKEEIPKEQEKPKVVIERMINLYEEV